MKRFKRIRKEGGAYTVITAVMMTVLICFLAMSIDIGYHYYRGARLQNAADAAATAVAANLGTIDTQYEDIAYQYLAKNGFSDPDGTSEEDKKVHCKVEAKGETLMDTVDSDDYIKAGYYKLTVWVDDDTFFAKALDIDSLRLVKYSWVKADAHYVAMPKALNYTVFAGSTKGTPSNPALQINGKTGGIINSGTALVQNLMNGFNTWVVKPIQAFTFSADTWWNPFTWKVGFDWNNANSWQAKLYTSNVTTSGDVHSNSNIESKIQAIHATRIQDTDFTHSLSSVDLAKYFDVTPIEDVTPTFEDYGQVTFDAVKEITFKVPSGTNILGNDSTLDTYYYVQNQQYIEQTQLALKIIDLLDFNDIANYDDFKREYETAADLYLIDKVVTEDQKTAIRNMVADGKLTYDASRHIFNFSDQANVIYSVNAQMANDALDVAYDYENKSGKYQGIDKMIFGTVEGDDNTYTKGIALVGNDVLYRDETNHVPYYSMRNVDNRGDEYDNRNNLEENINFIKYDEEGEQTITATAHVMGYNINREYQDFNSESKDKLSQLFKFTDAYTFNKTVEDKTTAGADFAIVRTFIENSDYIEVPNLKPYFIRQINKSIRNATKVKEKVNVSSAGQPTIRYAAKERQDTLKSYQDNLNFYDDTYRAADATALNVTKSNTMLFREYKEGVNSGIINLNDTVRTYSATTQDGLSYSYSISRYTYKGYNLYNGNVLKTPAQFYDEKLAEREQTKKDGKQAVSEYYNSTAKNDFTAVTTKKNAIKNENGYKYSTKQTSVLNTINNVTVPNITTSAGTVTPKVPTENMPNVSDYFLGNGTSPGSKVTVGENSLRTSYNSVLTNNAFPANSNFTIPSAGTSPYTSNQGSKGKVNNDGPYTMVNGGYYSSIDNPYYEKKVVFVTTKWRQSVIVPSSGKVLVTGSFTMSDYDTTSDVNPSLTLNSSSRLSIGGSLSITHGRGGSCTLDTGSVLVVNGSITINEGGTLNVGTNATVYVSGNVDVSNLVLGTNAKLYCKGTLQTGRTVSIGSGAVLYSKGDMSFPYQKNYTNQLTNNGKVICDGIISAEDEPITNNSSCLIIAKGGLIADVANGDNNSIINSGNIYVSGDVNSKGTVYTTGGTIQVLGGVYAANGAGNDLLHTNGNCSVYIRGVLSTTNGSNKNFWIDSGGAATVSILGNNGSTDVFNNKLNKFFVNAAGSNVYLGSNVNINTTSEEFKNGGNLYVYGDLNIPTSAQVWFTNANKTVIQGSLTANNASLLKVDGGHLLYVKTNINSKDLIADGSSTRVHADGKITLSGTMTLTNNALLEGVGGASATTYDTAGGEFNSVKTISFDVPDISANAMSEGYVKTGNVNATSLTLDNVKLKIDGNLTLSGAILLKNGSVLHVTGNVSCGGITLQGTQLYVNGNVTCSSVTQTGASVFLVRRGASVSTSSYSNLTCSGKINVANTSKFYCEGDLKANAYDVKNSGRVYGYRLLHTTGDYRSNSGTGYININGGGAADVFCGNKSAISNYIGIDVTNGNLFYPNSNTILKADRVNVGTSGKFVIDGTDAQLNIIIKSYAYVGSSANYVNFGKTKIESCRFTTEGNMYFVGGFDATAANTSDMTGGVQQSSPDYFYFKRGSDSFLGIPYNGDSQISTLELVSNYEAWGNVYLDASLKVKGFMQNYKVPVIGTEKGGKDLYGTEDPRVGHLGISMYIPKGVTYITGNLTTYVDTSKDSAIHIGNYDKSNNDAGLVVAGDINLASAIYNYGKFEVRGMFNLNNSTKQKVTEKNDKDKYKEGKSILNGKAQGESGVVFFVGNYDANGNIKNSNASVDLYGYIENYGKLFFNYKTVDIRGYNNALKDCGEAPGDFAFCNYAGAQAHLGGAVKLNSNQLFNKWNYGSNETVFTCDGALTYGGCIFNCGTVVVKGNITNNESSSDNSMKYVSDDHFSVMNGFTKMNKSVRENFTSRVYPSATLFCGGKMEVGVTEQGGESGSIMSCGTMYIKGDMNVYTNASSFKLSLDNFTQFWKNPESHSYFRTALWLYDNSNTFVGGNCFAGAGVATGKDSIFMVGGDYRSKRSTKLGIQMFMGTSGALGITLLDDYMSYKENTGDTFNSAYFYVGGNALVNTIGSTVRAFGVVTAPENNSRDMDIYPNTNIYIGGSLYANCKVYMKDNVDMVVAGNKTFYDASGNLSNLIYQSMFTNPSNFVPEKNLSNGLTVRNHLNANKDMKFYVYQSFDMMPNASMVVNGAMQVNETSKIRDMTKSYVYGSFICGKYVELGKALNDKDFSEIVDFSGSGESIAKKDGQYKFLSEEEKAYISSHSEAEFLRKYKFDKSAYMFVNGDYASGQDLGTGVLNVLDKIKKWLENTFLSTGYTKVYASSALKVNGNITSSRYITLRHDAKIYCKGNMDAATSIEGGVYSEWYVGGHMEAATSSVTRIIDALGGLFNIAARGKIELQDQARVIVGGNMFSSASIDIGELPSGAYTRGRKTEYTVSAPEGSNSYYNTDSDFQEALILTYENGAYKDKSGAAIYLDGSTYKYSDYKGSDNKNIEFGSKDNVMVYNVSDGKYHKKTYDGDIVDYSDGEDDTPDGRTPDTNNGLDSDDEPNTYGAEVFCQGSMIAQNGHIKEYAYTCSVVGDYVYAPDYITLRTSADLWVLPEAFGNETYVFLPYPDKPEDHGGFFTRLLNNITYYLGKFAYETGENFSFQQGSVYTFGSLTVNKNASLMGTNDLLQLGTITHADGSATSGWEKFLSEIGTFLNPRQTVLREDSLVLFGRNVTISSAPIALNLDVLKGDTSVAGFDSKGTAVYPGYQYKCTNHAVDGPHKGYNYTMTVDKTEHLAIQNGSETLTCDICGAEVNKSKFKIVQVSHPAVMFAGNSLYISTTVDMLMTYLIADQGDVYLHNFYTKTAYNENNLKELPNAISSYNGDINYTAWVGQLSSLFYAPCGNINFDGIYTDIYGSVIGNTVQMNAYYQNFHRFNNWRTMDLHIAESGSVYIIPEQMYNDAEELGQIYDLTSGSQYKDSPYGVRIFF